VIKIEIRFTFSVQLDIENKVNLKFRHYKQRLGFHGWFRCSEFLIEIFPKTFIYFSSALRWIHFNLIFSRTRRLFVNFPDLFQFSPREIAAIKLNCNCKLLQTYFFSLTMEEIWSAEFELFAEFETFTFNKSPPDKAAASARHEISRKLRHWRSASNVKVKSFICKEEKENKSMNLRFDCFIESLK